MKSVNNTCRVFLFLSWTLFHSTFPNNTVLIPKTSSLSFLGITFLFLHWSIMKKTSGIIKFNPPQIHLALLCVSDSGTHPNSAWMHLTSVHRSVLSCVDHRSLTSSTQVLTGPLSLGSAKFSQVRYFLGTSVLEWTPPRCSLSHHVLLLTQHVSWVRAAIMWLLTGY